MRERHRYEESISFFNHALYNLWASNDDPGVITRSCWVRNLIRLRCSEKVMLGSSVANFKRRWAKRVHLFYRCFHLHVQDVKHDR